MTAPVAAHPAADTAHSENPLHRLSDEQIEELGRIYDDLHEQVKSDLGQRDADYIRGVIGLHRRLALLGRVLLVPARFRSSQTADSGTNGRSRAIGSAGIRPVIRV